MNHLGFGRTVFVSARSERVGSGEQRIQFIKRTKKDKPQKKHEGSHCEVISPKCHPSRGVWEVLVKNGVDKEKKNCEKKRPAKTRRGAICC